MDEQEFFNRILEVYHKLNKLITDSAITNTPIIYRNTKAELLEIKERFKKILTEIL